MDYWGRLQWDNHRLVPASLEDGRRLRQKGRFRDVSGYDPDRLLLRADTG